MSEYLRLAGIRKNFGAFEALRDLEQPRVPARQHGHVVVEVEQEGLRGQRSDSVHREADADVGSARGVLDALLTHPRERAVGTVVDVHQNFVRVRRVAPDRRDRELQKRQVVPGRDDDGKHQTFGARGNRPIR